MLLKPKVLHITTWYPNTYDKQLGVFVQKHINQCYSFAENWVLVLIADPKVAKNYTEVVQEENARILYSYYKSESGKHLLNYFRRSRAKTALVKLFLDENFLPDLIHCHISGGSTDLAQAYFKEIPYVVTEHWSGILTDSINEIPKRKKQGIIRGWSKAKHVFAMNREMVDVIKQHQPKSSKIDNVIEQPETRANHGFSGKFLLVADLVDSIKNISGALDSFSIHLKSFPEHQLTIIGDGPDREDLQDKASQLATNGSINFLGRLSNLEVLNSYKNHDVLIINSNLETYSMVGVEALKAGLYVIATKCGGPEQYIKEGENGILINVADNQALIEALLKVSKSEFKFDSAIQTQSVVRIGNPEQIEIEHKNVINEILGL